jgi:phage terminase large subunit-like protein
MSATEQARKKKQKTNSLTDRATAYAQSVIDGKILAGPHVRNACRRHIDDLKRDDIIFNVALADRAIRFFETKLRLSEGQFEGKPFKSHPAQDFIIGSLFGWVRPNGFRRFRRAYIEQGKGNGKSPLAGGIGLYGLMADGEAGAEIYSAGATKEQAGILFRDAVKMVGQSPDLEKRLKPSGGPGREYNLAYLERGSFFRPVSRETKKTGSGPRPHFALVDELHEHPDGGIIEMLERGFKFRRQPLLLMITNSGSDRNSVCWSEHEWAIKVAAGNDEAVLDSTYIGRVLDDTTFSYVCALDEGDDPLNDPSCWPKANPLLGTTITEEYLAGVVAQAKNIISKQNGILRLHFCVWTDADAAWMSREVVEPLMHDFDETQHFGADMYVGLDLSQNRDITAAAFVVKTGDLEVSGVDKDGNIVISSKPTYDAWIEAWTPGDTLMARKDQDKIPYDLWRDGGFIHAPDGKNISYRHVAQTLVDYSRNYSIQMVAYDRYAFRRFEEDAAELGLDLPFVEHPQGGTKKGKPTEDMAENARRDGTHAEGLWFPGSLRILEDAMLDGRIRFKRNPVLIGAMMSAVTEEDRWDNRWLAKQKSINKIDAAVAMVMAVGAASSSSNDVDINDFLASPLVL